MTRMGRVATRFIVGPAAARSCLEIRPTASSQEATSVLLYGTIEACDIRSPA